MTPSDSDKDLQNYVNVSSYLKRYAEIQPYKRAVVFPAGKDAQGRTAYSHLTFLQLEQESDRIAHGFEHIGITRGVRTILMVKFGIDFFTVTYALLKIGAVPVIVDPGMGIERMLRCLEESKAEAFVGIPKAHAIRCIYRKHFRTVKIPVTVGQRYFWGGVTLKQIRQTPWAAFPTAWTTKDETAAILFTTGSTGPAKGAVYTHGMFDAQIRHIRSHFRIEEDETDLPTFPLFGLFDPALGMTAVIPDMDPTKPADADPEKIIQAVADHGVTNMFASPALLNGVGAYGKEAGIRLSSVRRVVSAGAPVSPAVIETFSAMLPQDAQIHTPYGATEAMPVLSIASHEILNETRKFTEQGYGICVGRPVRGIEVSLIEITDDPIQSWSDDLVVPDGEIGEITVKGDVVSPQYFDRPESDALAKISDGEGFRHRMGDLGWCDSKGRIWFCGRKSQRVITEKGTLYTIPCEAVFNTHPAVSRSALIGLGEPPQQTPAVCIELAYEEKNVDKEELKKELLNLASRHDLTKDIKTILFHKSFPVDIRHNAKIFREKLVQWAQNELTKKP